VPWHSALSQRSNCPTLAQLLSEPRPDRAQAGSALAGTCAAPPLGGEILQGKRALLTGGERLQAPPRRRRAPGPALARQGRAGYFHAPPGAGRAWAGRMRAGARAGRAPSAGSSPAWAAPPARSGPRRAGRRRRRRRPARRPARARGPARRRARPRRPASGTCARARPPVGGAERGATRVRACPETPATGDVTVSTAPGVYALHSL